MRYNDDYEREAGVWRFKKRVISFLYYVPVTEYPGALNESRRLYFAGERLPADYPRNSRAMAGVSREVRRAQ